MTLQAKVVSVIHCPSCDWPLMVTDADTLICIERGCELCGKQFRRPTLPLVEVTKDSAPNAPQETRDSELKDKVLILLARMRDVLDNGDGTDLYEHAQEWIVEAISLIPLLEKEWGKSVDELEWEK